VMSASTKVLVDVPGGNNVLYLPLDRMGRPGDATAAPRQGAAPADPAGQVAEEVVERLRREAAAAGTGRARERR